MDALIVASLALIACGPANAPPPSHGRAPGGTGPASATPVESIPAKRLDPDSVSRGNSDHVGREAESVPERAQRTVRSGALQISIEKELLAESRVIGGVEREDGTANVSVTTSIALELRLESSSDVTLSQFDLYARPSQGPAIALDLATATGAADARPWVGVIEGGKPLKVWLRAHPHPDLVIGKNYSLLARLVDDAGEVHWLESSAMPFTSRTDAAP